MSPKEKTSPKIILSVTHEGAVIQSCSQIYKSTYIKKKQWEYFLTVKSQLLRYFRSYNTLAAAHQQGGDWSSGQQTRYIYGWHKSSDVCLRSCLMQAFTAVARAKPTEQTTRERGEREREREREGGRERRDNLVRLEVGTGGCSLLVSRGSEI